ncbi:penicillin-binding protein activator [Oceaniglobus roseus]|uniref:penicillin-binding protein activator n=1 Tax=Oceaniglobus roseus TaxID=1737570 RepID=UPI000C7EEC95|nr:penicillin-binding protein activator [Kandeliimicrobium roseum]
MFAFLTAARKPIVRLAAAAFAALSLAACDPIALGGGGGGRINPSAPVQVALLVPASSPDGGALLSRSLENAARLAITDLDGVQIDLKVYDSGGQPAQAAEAATRAVADGAQIILGPVFAQAANAAGVAVADRGVNLLAFSNNTSIAGGNVFVLGNTFENTANRLVSYAARQGRGNIYVVHGQSTAEELGRDAILGAIQANRAQLAGVSSFELSQQGVTRAVPGIASAIQASGANALFMTSDTAGALPFLADLLPANGVSPSATQFIGLSRLDIPSSALSLQGLQGSWFALPDPGLTSRFESRYTAAYGSNPHAIAGLAYDGIAAIGALVKTGRRDALSTSALTQGSGFIGVNGIFRLRPDGTNQRGMAVAQIRNNQVVVIDPAPKSFGGPGF